MLALNEFKEHGVHFISLPEDIDTTTTTGKLLFSLLGAIAEFEKSLIRARVQAGVDRAACGGLRQFG